MPDDFHEFEMFAAAQRPIIVGKAVDIEREAKGDIAKRTLDASYAQTVELLRLYHDWVSTGRKEFPIDRS